MIDARPRQDPIESTEAAEAIEPTDRTEPIEPMLRTELREAMHRIEPCDHNDHLELSGTTPVIFPPGVVPYRCGRPMTKREIRTWLMDMDGVLVHEEQAIAGADRFIGRLRELERPFMVLTNNSIYTRRDLAARLRASGLDVPEESIWTSALATARFLEDQRPGGSAFVIGEAGLTTALHASGYTLTERDPDYVVLGETRTYSFERITQAIRLIAGGARFIATNPDATGPSIEGPLPATGSVAALITRATGRDPYFVGKPNPLMMRSALNALDAHSETSAMVGDRMDTDVVSGMEAGMETILVLTGVTGAGDAERYPYRAARVVDSIADLVDEIG
jgi:NagD protein